MITGYEKRHYDKASFHLRASSCRLWHDAIKVCKEVRIRHSGESHQGNLHPQEAIPQIITLIASYLHSSRNRSTHMRTFVTRPRKEFPPPQEPAYVAIPEAMIE